MKLLICVLVGLAAYAGYAAWPLYAVLIISILFVAWNLIYFGSQPMAIASGGPVSYLARLWILLSVYVGAFYGAGYALKWLFG